MANTFFQFKQFTVHQDRSAMKVTTDGCLFGAWVAEQLKNQTSISNYCLDIGTGTGLQSLMIVQKNDVKVDAIEIDKNTAEQAKENVLTSPFYNTINIIHADAISFPFEKKYNAIISNPPFYEKELKGNDKQKNIAHHDSGLLLKDLIPLIKNNLSSDGVFFLLLPYKRKEEIENLLYTNELAISQISFVRQTTQHNFFRIMIAGIHLIPNLPEIAVEEISIKTDDRIYSAAFIDLLKEYYLHL